MRSRAETRKAALRACLVAVLTTVCCACSSIRLLADPQRGFEADGPRALSLRFDRLAVEPAVDADLELATLAVAGMGGDRPAIVFVPLRAYNGTELPWTLHLEDFDLTAIERPDQELPPQAAGAPGRTPLVVVAPGGDAAFSLPLLLPAGILDAPRGRYRLRCRTLEDGGVATILQRDLVLDEIRPFRQTVYVVGMGAIILVVGVML
jgi:hypothetical protein